MKKGKPELCIAGHRVRSPESHPFLTLGGHMTLVKVIHPSKPQSPHLPSGKDCLDHLAECW